MWPLSPLVLQGMIAVLPRRRGAVRARIPRPCSCRPGSHLHPHAHETLGSVKRARANRNASDFTRKSDNDANRKSLAISNARGVENANFQMKALAISNATAQRQEALLSEMLHI